MTKKLLTTTEIQIILTNYRIGTLVHKQYIGVTIENQNYKIITTKGTYLLKFFEDADVPAKDIVFQNGLMAHLRAKGVKVPKVITTRTSETTTLFQGKPVSLYEFVQGAHITKFSKKNLASIAKEIAKLHTVLLDYKLEKKHKNSYYSDQAQGYVKGKKLRSMLIHADLGTDNILMKGDKVSGIIDFGNVHWGYLVNDLATFALVFLSKQNLLCLPIFFAEYQKHLTLTEDEKASLHFFMSEHAKGVLRWTEQKLKQKQGKQLALVRKTKIVFTKKLELLKQNQIGIL